MKLLRQFMFLLLLTVLIAGCRLPFTLPTLAGGPSTGGPAAANDWASLKIGQYFKVAGSDVKITFVDVTEDSRCPSRVNCVWSGLATVHLTLAQPGKPDQTLLLSTIHGPDKTDRTIVDGIGLRMLDLQPLAEQPDQPVAKADYVLRIKAWVIAADACPERLDDESGYLTAVCHYLVNNGISVEPGDPATYTIRSTSEEKDESGRTIVWLFLNCCGMGDIAKIDKATGEVIDFQAGAY